MRTLTIERRKSFVACLGKMKVYVEDPEGELEIVGTKARFLGTLSNGKTETFEVPTESRQILIIADKLSKNYCVERYVMPAGEDPIALSGQNRFDPAAGNAFRIDGNDSPEAQETRKKGTRIGWIVLIAAIFVGFLIGMGLVIGIRGAKRNAPKVFEKDEMTITLDGSFEESGALANANAAYESEDIIIFALKEEKQILKNAGINDLDGYYDVVKRNNSSRNPETITENGRRFLTYTYKADNGVTYRYLVTAYEAADAYWLFNFACKEGDTDARNRMIAFADTVKMGNEPQSGA